MLIEEYNEKNRKEYFAVCTTYIKSTTDGHTDEKRDPNAESTFIRLANSDEQDKSHHVIHVDKFADKNRVERFMILPCMEEHQRDCVMCVGSAGTGKSYLVNDYAELYHMLHPQNKIVFFTLNTADIDRSLNKSLYQFADMQKFCDMLLETSGKLEDLKKLGNKFKDQLLIFDDIGKLEFNKKYEKVLWNFINCAIQDFRKLHTNLFIIGHTSRVYRQGSMLKEEMTRYLVYAQSIQSTNDRILDSIFGFPKSLLKKMFKSKQRWACFECKRDCVVSPDVCYMLDVFDKEE